ncbi:MAG: hypothetical protein R3D70_10830 [Rhizobiaceae bacterium]
MSDDKRMIILPFRKIRGRLQPDQAIGASTPESAIRRARQMAPRYAGVAAIEFRHDDLTGESFDVRIIHRDGDVPPLDLLH